MLKYLKLTSVVFLLILVNFISACSLGVYTVTFIDYDGTVVATMTYSNGDTVTASNSPRPNFRMGFDFVDWGLEENVGKRKLNMYALYQINTNDLCFEQAGRKIQCYTSQMQYVTETVMLADQYAYVLLQDLNTQYNLSHVSISGVKNSALELVVFDDFGKQVYAKTADSVVWDLEFDDAENLGEFGYVLQIKSPMSCKITIVAKF